MNTPKSMKHLSTTAPSHEPVCAQHPEAPVGTMRTSLSFQQLQNVLTKLGQSLACAMCGHTFEPNAQTHAHACDPQPLNATIGEVQPMSAPSALVFYTDYVYGANTETSEASGASDTRKPS